jgi:rare lipoprotein A
MMKFPCAPSRALNSYGRLVPLFAFAVVALAGCAQAPSAKRSKEYFPESIYGRASPRVVTAGQAVPRGGGQYLVGRPYTIAGKRYVPQEMNKGQGQIGGASWYGDAFHGRRTANGEVYDMSALSAAHPTMPLPSYARVTNTKNNRSIMVRVNDRGPYHPGRVVDVSKRVADALDFRRSGTAQVKIEYVSKAGLAGSDDAQLAGSFRIDGRPATLDGSPASSPVMVAEAAPQRPQAATNPAPAPMPAMVSTPLAAPPAPQQAVVFAGLDPQRSSLPAFAPMPPMRPFDLATIPGADVPIMATPRRAQTASFYAPPTQSASPVAAILVKRRPFETVDTRDVLPLR